MNKRHLIYIILATIFGGLLGYFSYDNSETGDMFYLYALTALALLLIAPPFYRLYERRRNRDITIRAAYLETPIVLGHLLLGFALFAGTELIYLLNLGHIIFTAALTLFFFIAALFQWPLTKQSETPKIEKHEV